MLFQMSTCDVSVSTCSAAPKQKKINTEIRIMSLFYLQDRTSPLTRMKHCDCKFYIVYIHISKKRYPNTFRLHELTLFSAGNSGGGKAGKDTCQVRDHFFKKKGKVFLA